ncbi:MAG: prepilin-type N-terminal cleavage/methylation domain-containing protein [Nitrosomonadales bacterium]|nr:prepilin-type N-terminal cleavage/methylation domain-containing protein [Nitrosomonadales bacterium]
MIRVPGKFPAATLADDGRFHQSGFTVVELVTIMVILGIIAAVAAPRFFGRNTFDSRSFYDQVISTLRYAQKSAIAQRRFVCVAFTANSVTLTYDPIAPSATHTVAACSANLAGPTGHVPHSVSNSTASFQGGAPATFYFDALGRASAPVSVTVNGYATPVTVEAETGYVY